MTYEKERTKKRFENNFHILFNKAHWTTRFEVYKFLIEKGKNTNFKDFFEVSKGDKEYPRLLALKEKELIKTLLKQKRQTFLNKNEKELLNNDDYLKCVYPSQRGNNLLLITFFAQKKTEEKDFMNKLEQNYGIYLEVDDFIKEMKKLLSEVKSYSQLFEYVGSEFGKNKSDAELIRYAHEKASSMNYIGGDNNNNSGNIFRGIGIIGRGRGMRGIERGRGMRGIERGRGMRGIERGRGMRGSERGRGMRGRGRYRGFGGRGRISFFEN